jgi:hypothetical protein
MIHSIANRRTSCETFFILKPSARVCVAVFSSELESLPRADGILHKYAESRLMMMSWPSGMDNESKCNGDIDDFTHFLMLINAGRCCS